MRTRRRSVILLALVLALVAALLAACGGGGGEAAVTTTRVTGSSATEATSSARAAPASGDVTVFAAASLTEAFNELGTMFTSENPGAEVTFNFAASSALVQQMNEGAPADVYASADEANMKKLTDAGGNAGAPQIFAQNLLEIIVPPGNPDGITGLADLADPDLLVVTCAPEVPIGKYSAEALAKAGVSVTPASYEENVKAVVTKVTAGEADAGIVYATDVTAAGTSGEGVPIPPEQNVIAKYPIATTKAAPNPAGAAAFVDFVTSDGGVRTLEKFGFTAP